MHVDVLYVGLISNRLDGLLNISAEPLYAGAIRIADTTAW